MVMGFKLLHFALDTLFKNELFSDYKVVYIVENFTCTEIYQEKWCIWDPNHHLEIKHC